MTHKISNDRALQFVQAQKEKLETILASLREGVVLLDKDFRVVTANAAAEAIFKPADVIGKRLDDALAGFQHNLNLEALPALNTFQVQKAPAPGEARSAGLPRAPRVFSATLSRNTGVHDTSWMYALCLHDISQAHQLERMKSLFLNRLAHKICTPLTVVMATTSLVAKEAQGVLDSESKDLLQESMKHVEQCAALVRQFIEYTSLGLSDISSMKWARVSIEDLIEAALRSNAELIQRKQFRVVSLCPKGAVEIFGDREKLELVFHHLVQNAAKFGKTEGSLMIGPESKDRLVKVLFLDDGPGIPPGEMDNLGQLFYQVDPENTGEVPGAGFGLWLVRQIVQCHGGEVRLTSPANDEGGGTQVEVLVPGVMQAPKPFEGQTVDLAVTA
ncbi:MAG: PAS domain-containing sensor histidine kinase [Planctomycetes bacterium]|nr:PAS domain-containing sensor histidine kinase [Planctomycetota bacterium]